MGCGLFIPAAVVCANSIMFQFPCSFPIPENALQGSLHSSFVDLLPFPWWQLVVVHIFHIVPAVGGEFSATSSDCHHHCCLENTSLLGVSGIHFQCNVGVIQPVGMLLPPVSGKSMQLFGFNSLSPFCKLT